MHACSTCIYTLVQMHTRLSMCMLGASIAQVFSRSCRDLMAPTAMEWLGGSERCLLMKRLLGTWKDSQGSIYHLTNSNSNRINVHTKRPCGKTISTKVICLEGAQATWGKKYQLVEHPNCLEWRASGVGVAPFFWKKLH